MSRQPNPTMIKFGYPESLLRDYGHWAVLVRPHQATLGALILVCKDPVEAFSEISGDAFRELPQITKDIESGLSAFRPYQRINYLMLMMVDKDVHFHVLPRYDAPQTFADAAYADAGWPALPDLTSGPVLEGAALTGLAEALQTAWGSEAG